MSASWNALSNCQMEAFFYLFSKSILSPEAGFIPFHHHLPSGYNYLNILQIHPYTKVCFTVGSSSVGLHNLQLISQYCREHKM